PFRGSLTCRIPRALAHELTAAFIGEDVPSDGAAVNDLAGEFANMVCGRWLTDVAPESLFRVDRPVVVGSAAKPRGEPCAQPWAEPCAQPGAEPRAKPSGMLNGRPIWVELRVERRGDAQVDTHRDASSVH